MGEILLLFEAGAQMRLLMRIEGALFMRGLVALGIFYLAAAVMVHGAILWLSGYADVSYLDFCQFGGRQETE